MKINDLKILSTWSNPSSDVLLKFIVSVLQENNDIEVHFVDSSNSFPVSELQNVILQNKNLPNDICDRIRILVCLNLEDLKKASDKFVQMSNIRRIRQKQGKIIMDNIENDKKVLLYVGGLDTMFRNTQLSDSLEETYLLLKEILLKLRLIGNQTILNEAYLRTMIGFPFNELSNTNNLDHRKSQLNNDNKKRIRKSLEGNTLGEYVTKYFADEAYTDSYFESRLLID